jgi:uroporphyrinogen decarboxylase
MPIAVYPGATLIGVSVRSLVTDAQAQCAASRALHERFQTPIVLSAMDLSAEAEAFGCEIQMSENEVPTVMGRLVTSFAEAEALAVPSPGIARTRVYLDTVRYLKQLTSRPLVLAGCIGPFSLGGRLAGVSETCELTLTEPELVHLLLEKSTAFLTAYVQAFKAAGADGIIMAEPAAGLLSPRSLAAFSSAYIKRIVEAAEDSHFGIVLHNCAARLAHLPAVLESSCSVLHFGAPMDIVAALDKVPGGVVLCGNLDPISLFVQASPVELARSVSSLLGATAVHRNFIVSSGCDVPHSAPLPNLDTFFSTVHSQGGFADSLAH